MNFSKKSPQYLEWLAAPNLSNQLKTTLLQASDEELKTFFAAPLEFGTAGIRGIMGPGPGAFNEYTVKAVTLALINFLKTKYPADFQQRGVVIGHDNRFHSKAFAALTAAVLSAAGIPSYLFAHNQMVPTPLVSFATKKIQAVAGVVITASHNPAAYNGYKIYDPFGCQLSEADTNQIAHNMQHLPPILTWNYQAQSQLIKTVPSSIIAEYEQMLGSLQFYPQAQKDKQNLKIVFSGVNGTGNLFTPRLLRTYGYQVFEVPEHAFEDPSFKNVGNPNPEFAEAWKYPLAFAAQKDADLIIINDPDADRIGIAVKNSQGHYQRLNGNETGPLLIAWKLSQLQKFGKLPLHPVLYSSFVTSDLGDRVAHETYGVKIIKTLTGFKWMGAEIAQETARNLNFVFAYEESFGYVLDSSTRDKDGIQAAVMISELAWYTKTKEQRTLLAVLAEIYQKYGTYYTQTLNFNVRPEEKKTLLDPIMVQLRQQPPTVLCQLPIIKIEDYQQGLYGMPPHNLLKFYLTDGSWFAVRPSGTEPKLKIYFVAVDKDLSAATKKYHCLKKALIRELKINF